MSTVTQPEENPTPLACPLCAREFQWKITLWLHIGWKYLKSYVKWMPRTICKKFVAPYVYAGPILDGTTPVGFVTTTGKKIYYGKQHRIAYYFGLIK